MTTDDAPGLHFDFAFELGGVERLAGRLFGITPERTGVDLDGDRFVARFGPWTVTTPLSNIAGAEVTGPYTGWKVAGPARLSVRDRGLTFGTSARQGVCVRFRTPVRGIDPLGLTRHPGLTVTVTEPATLAEVLTQAASAAEEAAERASTRTGEEVSPAEEDVEVGAVVAELGDDLNALTAKELRERARALGISGTSGMKKHELVEALTPHTTG